jgi:toxin YhaV
LVLNGWTFLAWPAFDERWSRLILAVAKKRTQDPEGYKTSPEARLLKGLVLVIRDHIARDPNAPAHRLRRDLAAWRRVQVFGRYRLFYRFSSAHRVVVLAWLNDEHTLRKEGAKTDPYAVFAGLLARGAIPSDWSALVAGSSGVADPLPETGL